MKRIYNVLVYENYVASMESIMNRLRISLGDWSKSKTFELNGERVVNYTIICTNDVYTSIVNMLNV